MRANDANKKIIVVIPAYNEEEKIGAVVEDAQKYADSIVVVDDGSSDKTSLSAGNSGAEVIRHRVNRGQGAALETGSRFALDMGADIIVHFDADGQFLSEEIPEVVAPISKERADIVFGSRFMGKKSAMPPFKRFAIFPLARVFNWIFFGIETTDPQSGFRALSRKAAEKIRIENDRMAHCTEILAKAFQLKLKIEEIPIKVLYPDYGQRLSGGFKIAIDLMFGRMIK
jgi:polyprenyl-phospho-N-acetylgalactosaminyl synthase